MRRRILFLLVGFLVGLALVMGCQAAGAGGTTNHWLLYNTDDAHILCDNGQFIITANGADSIYIQCIPYNDQTAVGGKP